jgi:hypothetical protein
MKVQKTGASVHTGKGRGKMKKVEIAAEDYALLIEAARLGVCTLYVQEEMGLTDDDIERLHDAALRIQEILE